MEGIVMNERKRLHPHKFTMWLAIGSIVMMFAGLTSAYIVKRNQANWVPFDLPVAFWISTLLILMSSVSMAMSLKFFRERFMQRYRLMTAITLSLGLLFIATQVIGFRELWFKGITLQASVSYSFLYVIVGLHAVHVAGGVIAQAVMLIRAFSSKVKNYSSVPVELISTYWHFVDVLWIYLLVFLMMIR